MVELRPSAVRSILPDWFPVTQEEGIRFLQGMADEARGIALVLYNPPHAKRRLAPADFAELKKAVPSLVGVKVAGGDAAWFSAGAGKLPAYRYSFPATRWPAALPRCARSVFERRLPAPRRRPTLVSTNPDRPARRPGNGTADRRFSPDLGCSVDRGAGLLESSGRQVVGGNRRLVAAQHSVALAAYRSIAAAEVARLAPVARQQLPEFFPA